MGLAFLVTALDQAVGAPVVGSLTTSVNAPTAFPIAAALAVIGAVTGPAAHDGIAARR
ncbi:hypothetical protein [Microbacterium trichothecenolyticum]|uniref:Major facilitator superfamily (MFS) profile domain-containing protein n=1 Tax=Microbacterium trichothecenolyticum TaxID=69370 RepID=A0ABU0TVM3_MICTR|nr:hypothetical protein [Microbacterium trichothecenolyticum]MDQ1123706.1 hypothetical protein [Microbacterium trichothecenolyticum]